MLTRSQLSHAVSLWLLDFRKLSVEQLMFWNRKADKLLINIDDGKTVQVLKSPRVECWSWYPSSPHSQLPRLFAPSPNRLSRWSLCWSSDHLRLSWYVWSSPNIYYHDDHSVDYQTIHDCFDFCDHHLIYYYDDHSVDHQTIYDCLDMCDHHLI